MTGSASTRRGLRPDPEPVPRSTIRSRASIVVAASERIAMTLDQVKEPASLFLRLALGTAFLSAVADRFGLWGAPGEYGVAWGNFDSFLAYTSTVTPFLPGAWVPAVGWAVTVAELSLGVLLILGLWTGAAALSSGLLLLAFAIGMATGTGIKSPLDASVLSASAGAFLLSTLRVYRWSVDGLLRGHGRGRDSS